jgi:hypothetical protein
VSTRPEATPRAADDLDWMLAWVASIPAAASGFVAAQLREESLLRLGLEPRAVPGSRSSQWDAPSPPAWSRVSHLGHSASEPTMGQMPCPTGVRSAS